MSKYIDAEQLEKDGWTMQRTYQSSPTEMTCEMKKPTDLPSADVVEVRHGRWEYNVFFWTCSKCGNDASADWDYCPHCGARMDEVEE